MQQLVLPLPRSDTDRDFPPPDCAASGCRRAWARTIDTPKRVAPVYDPQAGGFPVDSVSVSFLLRFKSGEAARIATLSLLCPGPAVEIVFVVSSGRKRK